jgi:DNA polymerase III alpha subunit (gram-positive type)
MPKKVVEPEAAKNLIQNQIRMGPLSAPDIVSYLAGKGYEGSEAFKILDEVEKIPEIGKTKVRSSVGQKTPDTTVYYSRAR